MSDEVRFFNHDRGKKFQNSIGCYFFRKQQHKLSLVKTPICLRIALWDETQTNMRKIERMLGSVECMNGSSIFLYDPETHVWKSE